MLHCAAVSSQLTENEVSKWNFHTSLVFRLRTNKLSPTPKKFPTCVRGASQLTGFKDNYFKRGVDPSSPPPSKHIPSPFSMGCHFTLINSILILFVVENIKLGMFRNVFKKSHSVAKELVLV